MDTLQQKCGVAISVLLKDYPQGGSPVMQNASEAQQGEFVQAQYAGGCKGAGRYLKETAVPCVKRFPLFVGCCQEMCCISVRPRSFDFQSNFFMVAFLSGMLSVAGQCTYIVDHLRFLSIG